MYGRNLHKNNEVSLLKTKVGPKFISDNRMKYDSAVTFLEIFGEVHPVGS